MARIAQIGMALALLVVGGAAVQLAPGAKGVCGRGYKEFEHYDAENHPYACLVYCVPEGRCEKKEAVSRAFNFTGPGDCHEQGFTESAPLGTLTTPIMERLEKFQGPCQGMKVLKFKKPTEYNDPASPPASPPAKTPAKTPASPHAKPPAKPPAKLCTDGTPFKAIKDFRGKCTVYCVPDGKCLEMAETGKLGHLGIKGKGYCASDGYAYPVEPSMEDKIWIGHLWGSCKGMTMHQFQRSPVPEDEPPAQVQSIDPAAGRSCGPELHPFRSVVKLSSGKTTCSAYCVPDGPCHGMAEKGDLASLRINGEGGCGKQDFPEAEAVDNMTRYMVKSIGGKACKGMTVHRFQKPAPEDTEEKILDPAEGRSCRPTHYTYRAVKTRFGGQKTCSSFCVPDGACHGEMQMGHLSPQFGMLEEGRCSQKEFPEPVPVKKYTLLQARSTGGGPCREMTMHTFQTATPPSPEDELPALDPLAGRKCGRDQYPFRGVVTFFGGKEMCFAYCVPEGPCFGMAQQGQLKSVGITGEGGCKVGDFPEPVRLSNLTLNMVKSAGGGACKGMTVHRFQRQTPADEDAADAEEGAEQ